MASSAYSKRNAAKDGLDFYPTPPWGTRALFEDGNMKNIILKTDVIWEPACGHKHMSNTIKEYFDNVIETDIMYGQDFLNDKPIDADWIITNPPFNIGKEFAIKSIKSAKKGVAFLVRFSFLETIKRYEEIYKHYPPARILQFVNRVGFKPDVIDKRAGSAVPYVWIIWDKSHSGPTHFEWIATNRETLEKYGDYPNETSVSLLDIVENI